MDDFKKKKLLKSYIDDGVFFKLEPSEVMYYLYYLINLRGHKFRYKLPYNLQFLKPLLEYIKTTETNLIDKYVYITCKNLFVEPGSFGNRPGWHCDGFGTDDINYIWMDNSPTEILLGDYIVPNNDRKSLFSMNEHAVSNKNNIIQLKSNHLYKLTPEIIHREYLLMRKEECVVL